MTFRQTPAKPSRAPYPVRLALAGWIVAEAAAFLGLASLIGVGYTILAFLATSFAGVLALQVAGARSLARARDYINSGGDPSRELPNGYAVAGAVCLIVPGFVTDLAGLLLLFPPSRGLFRGLGRYLATRLPPVRFGAGSRREDSVIDGEVVDQDGEETGGHGNGPRPIR